MNTERERLVKEIFADALEKADAAERDAYLAQACGNDTELRERVTALLQAYDKAGAFLKEPAAVLPGPDVVAPPPLTEKPGDRIGHYKLLEQIGEGGCGVVYMAEQEQPIRRRVALKVIKLGMDTKQVVARFEAERQALALMDHPNIAKVLDAGATETGRPYFVMELVRGIKLTDYCDENNLSTEQRLDLFVQICHAIQHAHQKGVIHRDIKPSNILVTMHGGKPLPKIIDFGIAKATTGQVLTDKTLFTAFEQFIGTPAYMSPEQAEMSTLDIDTRSDIYALGVLLYELLTGQTPFDAQELVAAGLNEMRRIIREQEPLRPSTRLSTLAAEDQTAIARRRHAEPPQLIHGVRGDLDWIVMKCLEKDRTRRYETANGLADDIVRHLNDEPVTARPPGRMYRLQKLVRRNKLVFAVGAAVTAALVIGLSLSLWFYFQERADRQQAVTAEKKSQTEAARSQEVAQFLKDMLKGVGPSVALGRDTTMLREILDKMAERVGKDLKNQPEVEADLQSTMGEVYDALGQYQKAEALHQSALNLRRALWGNMNTNVADSWDGLGRELAAQRKITAAESAFQEALAIRTNLLGSEHVKVAVSLCNLGSLRVMQSRFPEAEELYRRSLALRTKLLGNEHEDVADSLSGLSYDLYNSGQLEQAEAAARGALKIEARVLPDERAATHAGLTQLRLGLALLGQDKLAEAEQVVRQVLTMRRNLLGTGHPGVAQAADILALVLAREKKLAEAEMVYREELAIRHQLGSDYVDTVCYRLAAVLQAQGKLSEVEALYLAELEAARKSSASTELAASLLYNYACFLRDEGKPAEAEPLFREGLNLCLQSTNTDFSDRRWLATGLALNLGKQGKPLEAEALFRETLEAARKLPPSADLVSVLGDFGDFLRAAGKVAEAEALYREGLRCLPQSSVNDYRHRQWLSTGLALVRVKQGKPTEAETLLRETVEAGRKLPPSFALTQVLGALADLLRDQGKVTESVPLYQEGLELCRRVAPNNETRQWLAAEIAKALKTQGKLAEAEPFYREALTNAAMLWPYDLKKWEWQFNDLVDVLQRQGKTSETEALLRKTVEARRKLPPSSDLAAVLGSLADVLRDQGKVTEAMSLYREGLDYFRLNPTNDFGRHGSLATKLASVLRTQGKSAEAEALLRETLEAGRKLPPSSALAFVLAALADLLRDQRKVNEALPLYQEGLDLCRRLSPNPYQPHQWLAAGMAKMLHSQGKLTEAEPFYREAVTNAATLYPNDFKKWEWQFNALVDVLHRQGKTAELEALYREGLGNGQKLPVSTGLAELLADVADKLRNQGKLAEAEPLYREGLNVYHQVTTNDFVLCQWLAGGMALALKSQGKLAEAEPFYREAVTNSAKLWPNDFTKWKWQFNGLLAVLQHQGKTNEIEQLRHQYLPAGVSGQAAERTSTNQIRASN